MVKKTALSLLAICFIIFLGSWSFSAWAGKFPESVALFYTRKPPLYAYFLYDWVVVDPGLLSPQIFKRELFWLKRRAKILAYLSVGEVKKGAKVPQKWVLGENPPWQSLILDLRVKGVRDFLLRRAERLFELGFEGLMLDTLDSYQLVLPQSEWSSYEKAEEEFIKTLRRRFSEAILIVNRPFRIIEKIAPLVDAFLAEGLFRTWDTAKKAYGPQDKEETQLLLAELRRVRALGLPIIVVDYVPPGNRRLAEETARRIRREGFIPWVTDAELSAAGVGTYAVLPREVLFLYDGRNTEKREPAFSGLHLLIQMPVEWLGFVPVFRDFSKELPEGPLSGRFRAVFIHPGDLHPEPEKFHRWVLDRIREGVKVFFIEGFGFPMERKYLEPLGLEVEPNRSPPFSRIKILRKASLVGFETEPDLAYYDFLIRPREGKALLTAENAAGQKFVPLALTPWGGYALEGSLFVVRKNPFFGFKLPLSGPGLEEEPVENLWAVDPFAFFSQLLSLDFPVPDVTTEDGKRLLTVHIDGDGFYEPADFDPALSAAEVILKEILQKYRLPHTVSVIEAEIAPWGINSKRAKKLETLARRIFALPWVEPASHTFSHPFSWQEPDPERLPVKGYHFSLEREIAGSIRYLRERLLSPESRSPVFLWSGDCVPPKEALALTYRLGIFNVNGGYTTITRSRPVLMRVSPLGINRGDYFQVYAPVMNENVYTHRWHGPYDGYVNVISTFELTETPRRLKPIGIYYHFFSGKKLASLEALRRIYEWALSQEVKPVFLSEYALKVLEFRATAVVRDGDCFLVRNGGNLRTVRLPSAFKIDFRRSQGIVGEKVINNSLYLFLDGSGSYRICPAR